MFGTRMRPKRERLQQLLQWEFERFAREAERLEKCAIQRDQVIATIITNIKNGAKPIEVVEWWEGDGKKMLEGYDV